ncbi:transcriptional regulator [Blautia schinkii]|nr:transcriptional regulator [Blautia schinkii]
MLMKISDHFKVSVDELLRGDTSVVQKIDSEKKKKNHLQVFIIILIFIAGATILGLYFKFKADNSVSFTMEKKETYQETNTAQALIDVGKGYFTLPKSGKINIDAEASTDDGKLHIKITDDKNKIYYQLDGQTISDSQTLYFDKGSYVIQIVADDYTEDVVSMKYYIKVSN